MNEHLSPVVIQDYHRQKLTPADLLGVDDHLAECHECRRLVEFALKNDVLGIYSELASEAVVDQHLTFEQMATYVDGLLTGEERRIIEDHLAACGECSPLVADLSAFRNEIAPDLDREFRPANTAPGTEPESLWNRVVNALHAPIYKIPTWVYVPLLLLLAVSGWLVWRAITRQTTTNIAITSPPTGLSPSTTPEVSPVVIARLNDGGSTLALDTQGRLTGIDQWPSEYQKMAKDALTNLRVERSPLLAGLSRPGSSLMGGSDEERNFAVIEPVGKVVLNDRVVFRWSKLEGATAYLVEVYDEQFKRAATSPLIADTSWTAPRLARGHIYSWQVKGHVKALRDVLEYLTPRPPAKQAKFRILDQAMAAEISRARRDYPSSHLLLGLLYARSGLLAEADQEFHKLQAINPDSEVARKLEASISGLRR